MEYNIDKTLNTTYELTDTNNKTKYNITESKYNITESKYNTDEYTNNINNLVSQINNKYNKSIELDTFTLLKDNISNFRNLNSYELLLIEHLSNRQYIELILLYDKIIKEIIKLI